MRNIRKSEIGNRNSANGGFTLIELLLVIGIILILIGILLPTVTQVRIAAQSANTRQMISRIDAGIASYLSDFQAYPGPIPTAEIGTNPVWNSYTLAYRMDGTTDNSRPNITSTENMFLGLVGGLRVQTASPQYSADITSTSLPTGPLSLNTVNPKKHSSYLTVEGAETTALTAPRYFPSNAKGFGGDTDTRIPEVLDKYSNPMPILYLRANRGNAGVVANNNSAQYNFSHLAPYGFTAINTTDFATHANDNGINGSYRYFGNPNVAGVAPYKKDAYLLISAGPDGKYGTTDDITNFRSN